MRNVRTHLIIEGRVQGVWFRDSTRREAMALGITGWVKNRPDGGVEIVAEGPENTIKKLTAWCHHGPPGAQVSRVMESLEEWKGEYTAFDIVY